MATVALYFTCFAIGWVAHTVWSFFECNSFTIQYTKEDK